MPVLHALELALFMFWEVLWPLALGFLLSAIVQTVVSRDAVVRSLGRDDVRGAALATLFGAASSSCSYAAVSVGRALFRRGATLANAIIFEFASTNLVIELGLVLLVLLGWPFLGAEVAGGVLMVAILFLVFRATLRPAMVEAARAQAERGLVGKMEGHGEMDMSITDGPFLRRLFSGRAFTAVSHYFFMDLASLYQDLAIGFLVAGALAAWVPDGFWRALFLSDHPAVAQVWGPLIGPVIAMLSFVCSVGNVPLAAVLWNGGISFGGVIAFVFGDLLILPVLDIYRKYYGGRTALYLAAVSYLAMALAGLAVGLAFQALGWAPAHHRVAVLAARPEWSYTTFLDLAFLALAAVLGWRFLRTGGPAMLRAMEASPERRAAMATDPVCGMTVDPATAGERHDHDGRTYHFCSAGCREAFAADPPGFLGGEVAPAHHH
ncbi:MAG TPA: permease [Candidatus Dormibacteraeota bacterium]|jgi:hypothetical protein|nr:permease [Candidatus Dormibacteraeota bacterium]